MRILFTFENPLPSAEADAEVFVATARHLAPLLSRCWLHVPLPDPADAAAISAASGMQVLRATAPIGPPALRHVCCGLSLVFRRAFWRADLVYTRNLWVAAMAILFGQRVAFDHYRPWPDQIPPLQLWLHRLICNRRFLVNICHSDYTRQKYLSLGVPAEKLHCIRNGFEPARLVPALSVAAAKRQVGIAEGQKTIVYTGRLNHKKGLSIVIEAARCLPDLLFVLVGSYGDGPIEAMAAGLPNVQVVPWQTADRLRAYIFAADVLLIPPSCKPLAEFGSTVLPLKLFLYMAAGRPILAGDASDVREVLTHGHNAWLCEPDCVDALTAGLRTMTQTPALATQLAATALAESREFTWSARAAKIADLVQTRLLAAPARSGPWSGAQYGAWLHQSGRWLVHLMRHGSFVLPPQFAPARVSLHEADGE
jgi:glycosyltransferase involved in cell wall biosynthesis